MTMPNRHTEAPSWYEFESNQLADGMDPSFRRGMPEAEWAGPLGPGDPRTTPAGDLARRGTIPEYVPFAVLNPRHMHPRVQ